MTMDKKMEELKEKLSKAHPEECPIRQSKYIPDCLIGKTKVWKDGNETITETYGLYPADALHVYRRDSPTTPPITARLWEFLSRCTVFTVGIGCKFFLSGMNTTIVHGRENLQRAIDRPTDKPLISAFNHNSCFDDPGLMGGILSTSQLLDLKGMRWGISATEVIFVNKWLAKFFALGKVIPITRGWGPKQSAMDFIIDRLDEGSWVNIFPDAKVYDKSSQERYRWGIGRLIMESEIPSMFLPIYHIGMNRILPNPQEEGESQPVVIRPGNLVTVCVGEPIDMSSWREKWKHVSPEDAWSGVTREVQAIMNDLARVTMKLHHKNIVQWLKRWHDSRDVYSYLLT